MDQHDLHTLPPGLQFFEDWADVRSLLDEHDIDDYVEATRLAELREKRILRHLHSITGGDSTYAVMLVTALAVAAVVAVAALVVSLIMCRRQHKPQTEKVRRGGNLSI